MCSNIICKYFLKGKRLAPLIASFLFGIASAQDKPAIPEKRDVSIQLSFYKKADLSRSLIATVKGKSLSNKFLPLTAMKVSFYAQKDNDQVLLNSAFTDIGGKAVIDVPKNLPLDENLGFTIFCEVQNDSVYKDAEEHVRIRDAGLTLTLSSQDTTRTVTAKVMETDKKGNAVPVKGIDVKFYTKRLFGIMPAAEEYSEPTDESGIATFSYPKDIKGDESGSITLVARIEDNESYGNIENRAIAPWGIPLVVDKNPFPRALWEPYAPLPLILTILLLFGGVWSTYFFIFFQLHKISKEGDLKTNEA
jgi:hypothetical protein